MIGQVLDGRYQVVRNLGEGGFSKTFLAEDTRRPGKPICVVKHLQPASTDPQFLSVARRLFHSEAEALEKLGHHDQIPRLLAFFEQQQEFYLVQEFIPGASLASELASGQQWAEAQVQVFLRELLETLAFIHDQGVIHRDIKPDNIIRRQSDGHYVLVDFGSVKQVSSHTLLQSDQMTGTVVVGTPGYMSSEQAQGKPRPNSDIYALGIVAIQALTGVPPSKLGEDEYGELLWQNQAAVSPQLATVLTKMVRYYFKVRYQNAQEVLQDLATNRTASPSRLSKQQPEPYVPTAQTRVVSPPRFSEPVPKSSPVVPAIATLSILGAMLGVGAVLLNPQLITDLPFFESLTATDNGPALLAAAQTTADTSGDLGTAINQLREISTDSSAYGQAQALISQWQNRWQQQQTIFEQAEAAMRSQNWYSVRTLLSRLPQNPYWDQRTRPLSRQASREIAELERVRSRPRPRPSVQPDPSPTPTPEPSPSEPPDDLIEETKDPTDVEEPIEDPSPPVSPPRLPIEIPVPPPRSSTPEVPAPTPSLPPQAP